MAAKLSAPSQLTNNVSVKGGQRLEFTQKKGGLKPERMNGWKESRCRGR